MLVTSNRVVYEEGDNATLTCTHLGGPGNTLQWLRDGKTLENSTNPTLAVTRISAKRSGEVYTCLVTNLAGEGSANLTLNIAPVILLHPQDAFTDNNSRVEFECSASGYPEPEYEWVKVGGSLPVTALVAENGSLIITEVNFGDEGVYFCTTTSNGITVSSNRSFLTSKYVYLHGRYFLCGFISSPSLQYHPMAVSECLLTTLYSTVDNHLI